MAITDEISQISSQTGNDLCILLDNDLSLNLPKKFEFSCDVKTNINGGRLVLGSKSTYLSTNYMICSNRDSSRISAIYRATISQVWGTSYTKDDNYHSFKFVRNGDNFEAFVDGVSQGIVTLSWFANYSDYTLYFDIWRNGTIYAKNIIIKPL